MSAGTEPTRATVTVHVDAPTADNARQWAETIRDLVTAEYGQTMRLTIEISDGAQAGREERLAQLAEKLCRSYTYGVGLEETQQHDPEEAEAHRDTAEHLLPWIEECPREERRAAYIRGYDRGKEVQARRTAQDMARLEAEAAELRQDRDPDGLRARIRDLEYALRGWDTLLMGRDRKNAGLAPDWQATAADYLAQLVEAQRELAELKGAQPGDATRRNG